MSYLHTWMMFAFDVVYVNVIYLILNSSPEAVYLLTYILKFILPVRRFNVSLHSM